MQDAGYRIFIERKQKIKWAIGNEKRRIFWRMERGLE